MTELNGPYSDRQWIEQVNDLLIEVARAALADIPKLPGTVSTSALPLAQQAIAIKNQAGLYQSTNWQWQEADLEWVDQVREFLLELSRIALSDRPSLPENIAHRALMLAETSQDIQEALENSEPIATSPTDETGEGSDKIDVNGRFNQLRNQLKTECSTSVNPHDPLWQQILTLLDVAQTQYNDLPKN
ncbi:hypothetical protein AB3M80_09400 [Arthrospira platensis BEA 1257B]